MNDREIRVLAGLRLEEREAGNAPMLAGYAAVFDTETDIGGFFRERIARGAFGDAISKASADVHALFNHDSNIVLGRLKAGTLRLAEDAKGLRVEIDPPDTQDVRDLMVKMRRGDIDQMSFAFTMRGGAQRWDESQDPPVRTIEKVGELYDVSVVTRGAYPTTEVGVRSLEEHQQQRRIAGDAEADALRRRDEKIRNCQAASARIRDERLKLRLPRSAA
ncbi:MULTISPECIES: HK97 family phage prohead protease [Rhodomicrobium]|uniref:HK97 family phage prohead protease n=1 Tax=Rhodomicrobium TaxID=1068 RepID=UPI0014825EA2|nr:MULTISPECIES: HK97 family phage prohead protease [Rhodomicrobium]